MNKIEKIVYDMVKSNPKIKIWMRNVYQSFYDLLPRKQEYASSKINLKEGFFFGYHDLQPFSEDHSKILANKLKFDGRMPKPNESIDVGYIEFDGTEMGDFVKLGTSTAWNYHKGCRLQWIDSERVIFNRIQDNEIVSQIVNIYSRTTDFIPYPIDSLSSDGKYATSFSYERLEKHMPGYGYNHTDKYSFVKERAPASTGLYIIDTCAKTSKLLVSLETLAAKSFECEKSSDSYHYVTHSLFSPDGKYISFFHRWVGRETRKRYTRLMIYNRETAELLTMPTGYMVSHYVWNNKSEIIAYCNYKKVDSHVLFNIEDFSRSHSVGYPRLNSDGHQSFIDDTSFVTDTYPDKWRMAKLYSVDTVSNCVTLLADVYSPPNFQTVVPNQHIACDLHPRVSPNGKFVCFDTAKTGSRSIAVMRLPADKI